jgi:DNA-binding NtrC family response regulator
LPGSKILLVEDDDLVRQVVRATLEDAGHDVTDARRFDEAEPAVVSGEYDLLISDVRLPGGSGIDLAAHAKARGRKVILITGYADVRELLEVQKVPHLAKPFRRNQLLALVSGIGLGGGGEPSAGF